MMSMYKGSSPGQPAASLHLLSNVAVGQTPWSPFWQQQITALQQEALAFQVVGSQPVPTLLLQQEMVPFLSVLFTATSDQIEQWPTWCTFLCREHALSDTFLVLSLSVARGNGPDRTGQHGQLVLRFQHQRHLHLLEAIERAGQLILSSTGVHERLVVPLLDPELPVHLDYLRPWYR